MRRAYTAGAVLALLAALVVLGWRYIRNDPKGEATAHAAPPVVAPPIPAPSETAPSENAPQRVVATDLAPPPPTPPVAGGELSVAAHPEWKPVTLSVLDRTTREDLKGVEVAVEPIDTRAHRPIDDSFERKDALRGDSPLEVPPKLAGAACSGFLVRAAGHAAALVDLDFDAGGAREVLLDPACTLRLRIDAPRGGEKLVVQLRRIEDAVAWLDWRIRYLSICAKNYRSGISDLQRGLEAKSECLRQDRGRLEAEPELLARSVLDAPASWSRPAPRQTWFEFDHLPPGEWLAIVVPASALDVPRGAAGATLAAGGAAERTIELPDRDLVGAKGVRGIVELATGWSDVEGAAKPDRVELRRDVRLVGRPSDASERVISRFEREDDSQRFTFDAGKLASGAWTAKLPQYGVDAKFVVDDSDPTPQEVRLVIGPPCDVVLAPVDAETRAPIAAEKLWFSSGAGRSTFPIATAQPRDGVYRFHAPLGRLSVYLEVPDPVTGYAELEFAEFELSPGVNSLTFEARPYAWFRILLKDGDAVVPSLGDECHVEADRVDGGGGGGVVGGGNFGGRDVRWIVSSPGRYSVRVVGQPGFLDSDPIEVDVPLGRVADLTIPLKRAR